MGTIHVTKSVIALVCGQEKQYGFPKTTENSKNRSGDMCPFRKTSLVEAKNFANRSEDTVSLFGRLFLLKHYSLRKLHGHIRLVVLVVSLKEQEERNR